MPHMGSGGIVLCDLSHTIVYMNPAAKKRYEKWGGEGLLGKSLKNCHNEKSNELIEKVLEWFRKSQDNNWVYTYRNAETAKPYGFSK